MAPSHDGQQTSNDRRKAFPPSAAGRPNLVGLGGLEPPTSRLSSARSNQLSYKPGRKLQSPHAQPLPRPIEPHTGDRPGTARKRPLNSIQERETKAAQSRKCVL